MIGKNNEHKVIPPIIKLTKDWWSIISDHPKSRKWRLLSLQLSRRSKFGRKARLHRLRRGPPGNLDWGLYNRQCHPMPKLFWKFWLRRMKTIQWTNPGASNAKAYGSDKSVSPRSRVCHCERTPTVTLQKIIIIVIIIIRKISFKVETHPTCILSILPSCV